MADVLVVTAMAVGGVGLVYLGQVVRMVVVRRAVRRERDRESACAHRLLAIRPRLAVGVERDPRATPVFPLSDGESRVGRGDPPTSSLADDLRSRMVRMTEVHEDPR